MSCVLRWQAMAARHTRTRSRLQMRQQRELATAWLMRQLQRQQRRVQDLAWWDTSAA
jgi:hypothetical protein